MGGIFASAPRVNAGRKRFRSLVVDIIGDDVQGEDGGDLHHASHPSHAAHAPHAAHAAGHASCSTLGLLRDLGDDTLQGKIGLLTRVEGVVLPLRCIGEKQRQQRRLGRSSQPNHSCYNFCSKIAYHDFYLGRVNDSCGDHVNHGFVGRVKASVQVVVFHNLLGKF